MKAQSISKTAIHEQPVLLPEEISMHPKAVLKAEHDAITPYRLGPVFYAGRSPFKIRVMILTCFAVAEDHAGEDGSYITYVGYKKEADQEFDFDEMIPSTNEEDAWKTHSKACDFFGNSPLFVPAAT
ncbi:MAG: hypothetical protein K1X61_04220 [Chitinophagales bacterium]|nr:hypothetical protein [Chitinophagales bacterium]